MRGCSVTLTIFLLIFGLFQPSIGEMAVYEVPEPKPVKADTIVGAWWYPHWGDPEMASPRLSWRYSVLHSFLGEYDANDPYVVDWHVKWAVEHGVTLLILSGYRKRLDGVLNSKYLPFIKLAFQVDLTEIGGFRDPRNLPRVLEWLRTPFFLNPSYYTLGGRPVLFISGANLLLRYLTVSELKLAFRNGRDDYRLRYGTDPFIVGMWNPGRFAKEKYGMPVPTSTDFDLASMFDAVTIYNFPGLGGENRKVGQRWELVAPYGALVSLYPNATERFINAIAGSGARFIPSATPGFNNTLLFKHGLDNWLIHRTGPTADKFEMLLKQMKRYVDPELNLLLLEAWNEFSEGSVIEPTVEHGFQYLDAVRRVFADAPVVHEDLTPESYAVLSLAGAQSAVANARKENRTVGLAEAEELLKHGESALRLGKHREATILANRATFAARSAVTRVLAATTTTRNATLPREAFQNHLIALAISVLFGTIVGTFWFLRRRNPQPSK